MRDVRHARAAWALAALVFATALGGAVVYLSTGEFSETWLRWSAGLYAAAAIGALALALLARAAKPPAPQPPEIVYETRTGKLERHAAPGSPKFVAQFRDGRDGLADVERRLDALAAPAVVEAKIESSADAAIARRALVTKKGGSPK